MKKTLNILFTVLLAVGWQWINVLNRQGQLTDLWVLELGGGLTAVLALQQLYLQWSNPSPTELARKTTVIANHYLLGLLAKYYQYMQAVSPAQQPNVRVNVMLPTSWYKLGSFLRMYYAATLPGVAYRNEEQVLTWKKGEGVSGWAWKHQRTALYDSARPGFGEAASRRTKRQAAVVGGLKSVCSEPIFLEGKIVGILNLDSDSSLSDTRFDHAPVQELIRTYADNLAAVCFPDGVRHK